MIIDIIYCMVYLFSSPRKHTYNTLDHYYDCSNSFFSAVSLLFLRAISLSPSYFLSLCLPPPLSPSAAATAKFRLSEHRCGPEALCWFAFSHA